MSLSLLRRPSVEYEDMIGRMLRNAEARAAAGAAPVGGSAPRRRVVLERNDLDALRRALARDPHEYRRLLERMLEAAPAELVRRIPTEDELVAIVERRVGPGAGERLRLPEPITAEDVFVYAERMASAPVYWVSRRVSEAIFMTDLGENGNGVSHRESGGFLLARLGEADIVLEAVAAYREPRERSMVLDLEMLPPGATAGSFFAIGDWHVEPYRVERRSAEDLTTWARCAARSGGGPWLSLVGCPDDMGGISLRGWATSRRPAGLEPRFKTEPCRLIHEGLERYA